VRAPVAVLVLGTALAVGVPTAWTVTRPDAAAGPPVASVLSAPTSPAPALVTAPAPSSPGGPPPVAARPAAPSPVVAAPPPVRLQLEAAGIDAPLDPVGVEPDGAMTLPSDVDRVGWYRFGPVPGAAEGTAVLAGHVDGWDQGRGALAALRTVEPGAEVRVTDATGATTAWRVVSRELLEKQAVPLTALFQRSGPPRLVLLTCGGPFDPELRSYRDNVVVVAEPVG
jgi:pyruvate/2-oxoglutarate dehydrogenase complex dihydrolipoamide acyltransferase (E2) component